MSHSRGSSVTTRSVITVQPRLGDNMRGLIQSLPRLRGKLLSVHFESGPDSKHKKRASLLLLEVTIWRNRDIKLWQTLALGVQLCILKNPRKNNLTLIFQNDEVPNAVVILLSSTNIFGDNMQYSNLYAHSILVSLE